MWRLARRPRWIAALLLALAVASGFAFLGHWQLDRSVQSSRASTAPTEKPVTLRSVARPQLPVTDRAAGQRVTLNASLVAGDVDVLSDRVELGRTGYWVIGHLQLDGGASLAVALGWAPTRSAADAAAASLADGAPSAAWAGRYLPSEPPQQGDFEGGKRQFMSVPAIINRWASVPGGVYGGYLVAAHAPTGLATIDSPAPLDQVTVNWLNIFYAVEWAVFAGFAIYLWYRVMRDAWEREELEAEEAAEAAAESARVVELN